MTIHPESNHIVVIPTRDTSHLRQILHLTLNLMDVHPSLIVTMMMSSSTRFQFDKEMNIALSSRPIPSPDRLRVVEMKDGLNVKERGGLKGVMKLLKATVASSAVSIERIISGQEQEGQWSTRPCLFIPDYLLGSVRGVVRAACATLGGPMIPVVPFISTMAMALHRTVNDTAHHGACEGVMARYEDYARQGMDPDNASRKACRYVENVLLQWPDLPPMYDYEWTPQSENRLVDPAHCDLFQHMWEGWHNADGFICVSTPEIDGQSVETTSRTLGVPVLAVGTQLGPEAWSSSDSVAADSNPETNTPALAFLDGALVENGPKSVLYISFGTIIWPTLRPELITELVGTLLDIKVPFIFATASPAGQLDDDLKRRIEESGRGMVLDWVPQLQVLQHPATGAFLTHCGMGSLNEAIVSETPILTMPYVADGGALSAHFTQIQKIGIELYQLSANAGLILGNDTIVVDSPESRRRELIEACGILLGLEGEKYRRRVGEVKTLMSRSRRSGGARKGMMEVAQWFTA